LRRQQLQLLPLDCAHLESTDHKSRPDGYSAALLFFYNGNVGESRISCNQLSAGWIADKKLIAAKAI
jgi:hypothetical protein